MVEDAKVAAAAGRPGAGGSGPGGARVARNLGWLLSSRGGGALIMLAALTLMARTLGAAEFGVVLLLHTVALVIRQLCNLRASEAAIMYGVPLLEGKRTADWAALLGALFRLDALASLVAGALGTTLLLLGPGLFAAAGLFDLSLELQMASWCYLAALLLPANGTAVGSLRVLNRYRLHSALQLTGPVARLVGILACGLLGLAAPWYVLVWALAFGLEQVVLLAAAALILLRRGEAPSFRTPIGQVLRRHKDAAGFLKTVYWQSNLDMLPRHASMLLAGGLFGAEGAGVFRYVRDVVEVLQKPAALLRDAIFPDLRSLWHQDRPAFLRLTWRSCLVLMSIGGLFVAAAIVGGASFLATLAGAEFAVGAGLLTLLVGAATLDLGGAALRPANYAMDKAKQVLGVQFAATVLYFVALPALSGVAGLQAAGWAALLAAFCNLAGLSWLLPRTQRGVEAA